MVYQRFIIIFSKMYTRTGSGKAWLPHELQTRDQGIGNGLGGFLALVVIDLAAPWPHSIRFLQGHHCYLGSWELDGNCCAKMGKNA
jgi:hypothetical protein